MKNLASGLEEGMLDAGEKAAKKSQTEDDDIVVERKPKYLKVTEKRLDDMGVIDLKPHFARSPHRTRKKDGSGWYMTIPIKRQARGMSRRMYDQLREVDLGEAESKTVVSDYLYDRRKQSDSSMLNYEPKSNTITKEKTGKNRHQYVAYRTVSDTSPPNSWIINRSKVNKEDTSKTFVKNVDRLMKWKMKNGWS